MSTPLPEPRRERWQPLRVGLVDLFHYDEEEFHFHDGRLLLRGNNGTGKSKVMALTLPFLLDGRLTPSRLEPDGDPGKRMEWNLLLGGRYTERQGYCWLELGRANGGTAEYFTVGCGLKAVQGRATRSWFFTFDGRVGRDLALLENERSLGRERLIEALGERGRVFDAATAYRRAIDERLFQLGEERFEALLSLLIQLRQPQLSKRPDPAMLSNALTNALPPLDRAVLNDVAEAFRSLDAERDELRALEEARTAVDEFLLHYRQYAAIAARRRGRVLRQAHSRYEDTRAELRREREALASTREAERRNAADLDALRVSVQAAEQRQRTLHESPAMRSAESLQSAESLARELRAQAEQLERSAADAEHAKRRIEERLERERREALAAERALEEAIEALDRCAVAAGMAGRHRQALAEAGWPDRDRRADALTSRVERVHRSRREAVTALRVLNAKLREAETIAERAHRQWQEASREHERREQDRLEARQALEAEAEKLVAAYRTYLSGLGVLAVEDREALVARLADWSETLDGASPAERALEQARTLRQRAISSEKTRVQAEHDGVAQLIEQLVAEQRRLERGEHARPAAPPTRAEGARADRPGAPLWQLVDFGAEAAAATRPAIEAALEASGLLDAWVMPDGEVLDADTWDTILRPAGDAAGTSLADVLEPAVPRDDPHGSGVAPETVARVLGAIGWGASDAHAWIDAGGRWRLGPLTGAWAKPEAEFIGFAAREAARAKRLAELAAEIDTAWRRLESLAAALAEADASLDRLEQEWQARPPDQPLRDAHVRESERARASREQAERVTAARAGFEAADEQRAAVKHERDETAADLSLPTDDASLDAVDAALHEYAAELRRLPGVLHGEQLARRRLAELDAELAEAATRAAELREQHLASDAKARRAEVRRDTLRESLGAEVQELERRLAEVAAELERLEGARRGAEDRRVKLAAEAARLEGAAERSEADLAEQERIRREAIERLQAFAAEGLLRVAVPPLELPSTSEPWAAEPAVRVARRIEQALEAVADDDAAWQRHQRGLQQHFTTLAAALTRRGHDASAELADDLLLVRIVFRSQRRDPDELARDLHDEIVERRTLLDNKERELLETYLIDEVASHLQQMMSSADRWKLRINEELERHPTSTGMRLRIQWEPLEEGETHEAFTAPAGLKHVRERLRQVTDAWSAEDREAIGRFLQARIQEVRSAEEGGALLDLLDSALDYRHWHRFNVERWQDGRWRPAYGPASGGERALVITLPLFAAAASHYGSASPAAPRLVMLDEVFAGIDDHARAKCMGLLAQFDLDVMMTSEREWGCYAEMPGLAIAHLVRKDGVDAVLVTRWRWTGRQRVREDDLVREAPAEVSNEEAEAPADTLL